ncbi:MAG TPA: 7-cyano-7-deazaguanine synthase QueC [Elusimicrobiota bacterium]|nr:7-cyano-7-deazaguanine synthase QueC [Elusimicrobiota bacterium]
MAADAVVLLSGGLDSSTALSWALKVKKWRCHCLVADYGQRHRREITAALRVARRARCPVHRIKFRLPWGGSSLLNRRQALPVHAPSAIGRGRIPSTYVPARNTIFLSFALSLADVLDAENIVVGANALDYSGYPDCRPKYYAAVQKTGRLGTRLGTEKKRPLRVWAPLLHLTKKDIVRRGARWGTPYELTWSCYRGGARPCGRCDSCRLRARGFQQAGLPDPLLG